ncbi:MAG: hypothetical protein WBP84_02620, partial [Nitrososphaeraceae archaeon]
QRCFIFRLALHPLDECLCGRLLLKIKHIYILSNVDRMIERSPFKTRKENVRLSIEKITEDPQFFDYYLYSY